MGETCKYLELMTEKYADKTSNLRKQEQEMRQRVEAMEKIINNANSLGNDVDPCECNPKPELPKVDKSCSCGKKKSSIPVRNQNVSSQVAPKSLANSPKPQNNVGPVEQKRQGSGEPEKKRSFIETIVEKTRCICNLSSSKPADQGDKPPDPNDIDMNQCICHLVVKDGKTSTCKCEQCPFTDEEVELATNSYLRPKPKEADSCICITPKQTGSKQPSIESFSGSCICASCPFQATDADGSCICANESREKPMNSPSCICIGGGKAKIMDTPFGDGQTKGFVENCSISTLQGKDIDALQKLNKLVMEEKDLSKKVGELEKKEQQYNNILNNLQQMTPQQCVCNFVDSLQGDLHKENLELKTENMLLRSELKEMKVEVRQYLERTESPAQFQLYNERLKTQMLEDKMEALNKDMANMKQSYCQEMNAIRMNLCCARSNVFELTAENASLKEQVTTLTERCSKLEEDIVNQKMQEAETILQLKAYMPKPKEGEPKSKECDSKLSIIARKLSQTMQEFSPCGECAKLPPDVANTAKCIKELTDMVDRRIVKCGQGNEAKTLEPIPEVVEVVEDTTPVEIEVTKVWKQESVQEVPIVEEPPLEETPPEATSSAPTASEQACVKPASCATVSDGTKKGYDVVKKIREEFCQCVKIIKGLSDLSVVEPEPEPKENPKCKCGSPGGAKPEPEPPKKICKCSNDGKAEIVGGELEEVIREVAIEEETADLEIAGTVEIGGGEEGVVAPVMTGPSDAVQNYRIAHKVETSRNFQEVKSQTAIKAPRNKPLAVDTEVDIIDKPTTGVHVTTTITKSGTLEVITEGPEGVIETVLMYNDLGNLEILTEVFDYGDKQPRPLEGDDKEPLTITEVSPECKPNPKSCRCPQCPAGSEADKPADGTGKATDVEPSVPPEEKAEEPVGAPGEAAPRTEEDDNKSIERIVIGES